MSPLFSRSSRTISLEPLQAPDLPGNSEPDGTIIKVNATFLAWTGYDRDAVVGRRRFQDLLEKGDRIFYETHAAPMLLMQGMLREGSRARCFRHPRAPPCREARSWGGIALRFPSCVN
jgi:PAS domain-containing protein